MILSTSYSRWSYSAFMQDPLNLKCRLKLHVMDGICIINVMQICKKVLVEILSALCEFVTIFMTVCFQPFLDLSPFYVELSTSLCEFIFLWIVDHINFNSLPSSYWLCSICGLVTIWMLFLCVCFLHSICMRQISKKLTLSTCILPK